MRLEQKRLKTKIFSLHEICAVQTCPGKIIQVPEKYRNYKVESFMFRHRNVTLTISSSQAAQQPWDELSSGPGTRKRLRDTFCVPCSAKSFLAKLKAKDIMTNVACKCTWLEQFLTCFKSWGWTCAANRTEENCTLISQTRDITLDV